MVVGGDGRNCVIIRPRKHPPRTDAQGASNENINSHRLFMPFGSIPAVANSKSSLCSELVKSVVGMVGIEPTTNRLWADCSNHWATSPRRNRRPASENKPTLVYLHPLVASSSSVFQTVESAKPLLGLKNWARTSTAIKCVKLRPYATT